MKTVFIVTGTTRGIGKAIKEELQKSSDNEVFCLSRKSGPFPPQNYEESNIHNIVCDLLNRNDILNSFENIFNQIKGNDYDSFVLINNAGVVTPIKKIKDANLDEINNSIDINLKALVYTTAIFLKKTEKLKAKKIIVNITSGAAHRPCAGISLYNSTKAAVEIFTQSVAYELQNKDDGALIIGFTPARVDTDLMNQARSAPVEDFPNAIIFVESMQKGELLSAKLVAGTLINLISKPGLENGKIYKIREILGIK